MFLTLGLSFFFFFFFLMLSVDWLLGTWRFRSLIWSRKVYCFLQFERFLVCFLVVFATSLNLLDISMIFFLLIINIFDSLLFQSLLIMSFLFIVLGS